MTGITVSQGNGTFDINAKSVILACGSYANNPRHDDRQLIAVLYSCANAGATGEVLQMAATWARPGT